MPTGIVIPSDETRAPFEKSFERLEDYQTTVGGLIEGIHITDTKLLLYANEEGKIHDLPFNRRATAFWWLHDRIMREQDELVGDVVLLGTRGTVTTNLPEDLAQLILHATAFRTEIRIADRLGWHRVEGTSPDYFHAAIQGLLHFRSDDIVTDIRVVEG